MTITYCDLKPNYDNHPVGGRGYNPLALGPLGPPAPGAGGTQNWGRGGCLNPFSPGVPFNPWGTGWALGPPGSSGIHYTFQPLGGRGGGLAALRPPGIHFNLHCGVTGDARNPVPWSPLWVWRGAGGRVSSRPRSDFFNLPEGGRRSQYGGPRSP